MKSKLCIVAALLAMTTVTFLSCKKSDIPDKLSISNKSVNGFPNEPFNWEDGRTVMMPTEPNGPLNPSLPWTSQNGSTIDPNFMNDQNSKDGWVHVYNTFNHLYYTTNASSGGLYFALYNIYRGLLRFYLYIPSGYAGAGSELQHGLVVNSSTGATSSMLNFEGSDIVDPNTNNLSFTKTNNTGISLQGGWYAMQYELAYDPNFSSSTFPNLYLSWIARQVAISDIAINGTSSGTIEGNITQQANSNLGSSMINGAAAAAEIVGVSISGSKTELNALENAAAGGLAGNVTNFLSGIFGGNSSNSQTVDLKMNETINLAGTITTNGQLFQNSFVFPGQTITTGNGSYEPLYTSPLGVFNFSNRPTVKITKTLTHGTPASIDNSFLTIGFTIDDNPLQRNLIPT